MDKTTCPPAERSRIFTEQHPDSRFTASRHVAHAAGHGSNKDQLSADPPGKIPLATQLTGTPSARISQLLDADSTFADARAEPWLALDVVN
jgi:hypothetical protein